jgi:hypothetical protein
MRFLQGLIRPFGSERRLLHSAEQPQRIESYPRYGCEGFLHIFDRFMHLLISPQKKDLPLQSMLFYSVHSSALSIGIYHEVTGIEVKKLDALLFPPVLMICAK